MKRLTDREFHMTVERGSGPFLVELTAYYCGVCHEWAKDLEAWSSRNGIPCAEVELYESRAVARKYKPAGVPTTILFIDGKEEKRWVGPFDLDEDIKDRLPK